MFIVGGMIPSFSDLIAKIASIAPAAPKQWPIWPFVEVTGGQFLTPLNSSTIAFDSLASPTGVEVPWVLI